MGNVAIEAFPRVLPRIQKQRVRAAAEGAFSHKASRRKSRTGSVSHLPLDLLFLLILKKLPASLILGVVARDEMKSLIDLPLRERYRSGLSDSAR